MTANGTASVELVGAIGRVASPLRSESTSVKCYFWVPAGTLAERTQLVRIECQIAGRDITFYGVVEEVFRRSRRRSIDEEVDTFDGDLAFEPPFAVEGLTYAETAILYADPPRLTPPLEQSLVYLGTEEDAGKAYGYAAMVERDDDDEGTVIADWSLPIGLLRSGGEGVVGVAKIDLRDLIGDRAGHLNVTGQAGRATKSSFLLTVVRALIDTAHDWNNGNPRRPPFSARPIVFNVKGEDLMHIDHPNRHLSAADGAVWEAMGIAPAPFARATFYAPCDGASRAVPAVMRDVPPDRQTIPFSYTLRDVLRLGLWPYLFSDETQRTETMAALADHILGEITEPDGVTLRAPNAGSNSNYPVPQSFRALADWMRDALRDAGHPARDNGIHTHGTIRALLSRLGIVRSQEGRAIFDDGMGDGRPLDVIAQRHRPSPPGAKAPPPLPDTIDPIVIDIHGLPAELRRFVVAAVLHQVKEHQMARRTPGQVYFLVLDELGIYAPRGARDPITRLFEHVAAQLRSQGIILLGAQQQASMVSETIFGNSQFKALGATGPVELASESWNRLLSPTQRAQALMLRPQDKMLLVDRGWMNVITPFPAWAMKRAEAAPLPKPGDGGSPAVNGSTPPGSAIPLALPGD